MSERRSSFPARSAMHRARPAWVLGVVALLAGAVGMLSTLTGCSNLTGWRIPGTEKAAGATTKVYLVLENVDVVPEEFRTQGEIFVDDAFFGNTSRPVYYPFVGNALVVGEVNIEKEKIHTVKVIFPGYEPFEATRYFGTLPEYSISFRLKQVPGAPAVATAPALDEGVEEKEWYQFWRWFGE